MTVLLALAPILVTLALLLTRLPAWAAPAAGCVTAAVLGVAVFGTDPARLGAALVGGAPTLLEVAAIIAGGITLSRIMERSGANGRLGEWLSAGAGPTLATALLMVHGVVPFLEAVTGFGVSLIIGVPLLVGLGFTPFRAAVLSLCGLAIAPWGSMAPGTLLGARLTGLDFQQIGVAAALWNVVPTVAGAVVAAVLVLRGRGRRGPTVLRGTAVAVGSAVLQSGLILAANIALGTAPAGAVGTASMILLWLLVIHRGRLTPGPGRDVVPYALLVAGVVAGTLAATAEPALNALGSPAVWSLAACAAAVPLLRLPAADRRAVPGEAAVLWWRTAVPTALYLAFGLVLTAGGMSGALADALGGLGPAYLFLAPFVGGAGGFITASNTGSMAMFGALQLDTAHALGVSPVLLNGLHNSATGWGIVTGPVRIQVASALAAPLQRPGMPGLTASPRNLAAVMLPAVVIPLAVMGAIAAAVLPRVG
ncbi:L-lactate permease [uncultured Micrococcus sp.]|uniref:L-lactate permease n=1 Tax=uncultured Micrococcus sp. TaxID=114051 RepID=UPI0025DC516D|nr:L-lactate permease [uncultured Micrococcus sp.]